MTKPAGCLSNLRDCEQLCDACRNTNKMVRDYILQQTPELTQQRQVHQAIELLTGLGYQVLTPQEVQQRVDDSWRLNPDRSGGQFTDQEIAQGRDAHWDG
jgi:hypothetical protein